MTGSRMDTWTVLLSSRGVEVRQGDLSEQPAFEQIGDGEPGWVAVAQSRPAAERWATAFLEYLTDPAYGARHFSTLIEMTGDGVPKVRIPPRA